MSVVVKILGFANGKECPIKGMFLESFDFEAYDGRGFGEFTKDIKKAKRFSSHAEFFSFYKTIPKCCPTRPDGLPNRPMSSCHWEIMFMEKQNDAI